MTEDIYHNRGHVAAFFTVKLSYYREGRDELVYFIQTEMVNPYICSREIITSLIGKRQLSILITFFLNIKIKRYNMPDKLSNLDKDGIEAAIREFDTLKSKYATSSMTMEQHLNRLGASALYYITHLSHLLDNIIDEFSWAEINNFGMFPGQAVGMKQDVETIALWLKTEGYQSTARLVLERYSGSTIVDLGEFMNMDDPNVCDIIISLICTGSIGEKLPSVRDKLIALHEGHSHEAFRILSTYQSYAGEEYAKAYWIGDLDDHDPYVQFRDKWRFSNENFVRYVVGVLGNNINEILKAINDSISDVAFETWENR